jgi:hypothetical protein
MTNEEKEKELMDSLFETFKQLDAIVRSLSPVRDGYCSLTVGASGFQSPTILLARVFYHDGYTFDVCSIAELRKKLAEISPESVRQKRISKIKAELEKLEAEGKEVAC